MTPGSVSAITAVLLFVLGGGGLCLRTVRLAPPQPTSEWSSSAATLGQRRTWPVVPSDFSEPNANHEATSAAKTPALALAGLIRTLDAGELDTASAVIGVVAIVLATWFFWHLVRGSRPQAPGPDSAITSVLLSVLGGAGLCLRTVRLAPPRPGSDWSSSAPTLGQRRTWPVVPSAFSELNADHEATSAAKTLAGALAELIRTLDAGNLDTTSAVVGVVAIALAAWFFWRLARGARRRGSPSCENPAACACAPVPASAMAQRLRISVPSAPLPGPTRVCDEKIWEQLLPGVNCASYGVNLYMQDSESVVTKLALEGKESVLKGKHVPAEVPNPVAKVSSPLRRRALVASIERRAAESAERQRSS